jgi:hypothetical protein
VVTEEEVVGHLTDGRTASVPVAPDGQEQLVLSRRQSRRPSLVFAPPFKVAKTSAQGEEAGILLVG